MGKKKKKQKTKIEENTPIATVENETGGEKGSKIESDDNQKNRTVDDNEENNKSVDDGQGSTVNILDETFNYPFYYDEDGIPYYPESFSLKEWLDRHQSIESRWSATYNTWVNENKSWITTKGGGDRPRREVCLILQSVIIALLDYHKKYGYHGNLTNLENYNIEQLVIDAAGRKIVKFKTHLLKGIGSGDKNIGHLQNDINVTCTDVFQKILDGCANVEMAYLADQLFNFYSNLENEDLELLLRDYPGFWDGTERACFYINFHFHLVSSEKDIPPLQTVLDGAECLVQTRLLGWQKMIPPHSVFTEVLGGRYHDSDMLTILTYIRNVMYHFGEQTQKKAKKKAFSIIITDLRHIELSLSQMFPLFLVMLYWSMCKCRQFLP